MRPTPHVRQEIVIDAPPERVFEAWANPDEISQWYVEHAEGDPRYEDHVIWVIGGEAHLLEVDACIPGRRLVLENVGNGPWRGTSVRVDVRPEGDGTLTVVEQSGFSGALLDDVSLVDSGWACVLAVLREHLEHPERRATASATELVRELVARVVDARGRRTHIDSTLTHGGDRLRRGD